MSKGDMSKEVVDARYAVEPKEGLFLADEDDDHACVLPDLHCRVTLGLHSHKGPHEALVFSMVEIRQESLSIARASRRVAAFGPVSHYKDPVLHRFIAWSAERLESLSGRVDDLLEAVSSKGEAEARKIVEAIRAEAEECVTVAGSLDRVQSLQMRSGRIKQQWVDQIYNTTFALFQEYADLFEIGYLVDWVFDGTKPTQPLPTPRFPYGLMGAIHVQ